MVATAAADNAAVATRAIRAIDADIAEVPTRLPRAWHASRPDQVAAAAAAAASWACCANF